MRLAAERAQKDKPFEHLRRIPPLPVPGKTLEFRVLSSEEQVREAAETLKNCAASYIPKVVKQKCALVGLFRKQIGDGDKASKIVAMGELFVDISEDGSIVTRWGQRVQACNESLTKGQRKRFNRAGRRFSELWTKAIQNQMDRVFALAEKAIRKPADPMTIARDVGRLLRSSKGPPLRKVVDAARQLDWSAKLTVLLSHQPDLMNTLSELLLSAAKARDASLADSIVSRLLKLE